MGASRGKMPLESNGVGINSRRLHAESVVSAFSSPHTRPEKAKKIIARPPEIDPKGMGVSGLLRSELFGLSTTLDPDTQNKINKKLELSFKSQLTENELEELNKLAVELGSLDFIRTIRDPFYDRFLRAISSRDEFKRQILTPPQIKEQEKIARKLIDEILEEEK